MANYYTLFSCSIKGVTFDEQAWLEAEIIRREAVYVDASDRDQEPVEGAGADFESYYVAASGEFCLYADESSGSNLDDVCSLVQSFLKEFRQDQSFSFSWANTCSRSRIDAFSGGAAFVTADEIRTLTTSEWLYMQQQIFDADQRLKSAKLTQVKGAGEP